MNQSSNHELVRQAVESGAVSGIYYVLVANVSDSTLIPYPMCNCYYPPLFTFLPFA